MIFYWVIALVFSIAYSCVISGTDTGQCVDLSSILKDVSFCSEYITQKVCVPIKRTIWPEYDVAYRNNVVQQLFVQNIEQMLINEFQNGASVLPFESSISCSQSYKKFLCSMNFPSCDENNKTVALCNSVCTDFYSACSTSTAPCYLIYSKIGPGFDQQC